jgi:hypothetical protein
MNNWEFVTRNLLTSWDAEEEAHKKQQKESIIHWFKSYLSELDALLVECRQFEKKIETRVRELFLLDKEKGSNKLSTIFNEMEDFFHKYKNEKRIQEILAKWQTRYKELKEFQNKRPVKLIIKQYGCDKKISEKLWKDDFWESLYLYLRIEIEGMSPVILDLSKGNLSYNGSYEIKQEILWKPWLSIQIKLMDADGDIDKETIGDDDVLRTIEFKNIFSIHALTDKRIERAEKEVAKGEKEEIQFWFKCDLVDQVIPQWLLDIYRSTK